MDRISDSGSEDRGSNPFGNTKKAPFRVLFVFTGDENRSGGRGSNNFAVAYEYGAARHSISLREH